MGTITNKFNLPEPIVEAVKADSYEVSGDISTTSLISPPQVRMLKKMYGRQLQEDVSEYIFALFGTAVHHVLERSHIKGVRRRAFVTVIEALKDECKNASKEEAIEYNEIARKLFYLMEKLFPEVKGRYIYEFKLHYEIDGFVLSGKFDLYDTIEKCLYDYKVCSVYAWTYPESRKSWTKQLNIYAFMLRNEGYVVDDIKIVAIFRDWSKSRLATNPDYPQRQVMTIPLKVYTQEQMKIAIEGRMKLHQEVEKGIIPIPDCTKEEQWSSADVVNIKKKGLKRRIAGVGTEEQAKTWIRENQHKYPPQSIYYEIVPGERKKCAEYCAVRDFCPQKKREDEELLRLTEE